jgi:hypothetical protein
MNPRGRKERLTVDEKMLNDVYTLAGRGMTQEQIAQYFGLSNAGWYKYCKRHPALKDSVSKGQAQTLSYVCGKLFEMIKAGNVTATIFYLKTRGGFSEKAFEASQLSKEPTAKIKLSINTKDPIEAAKIYQEIMQGTKTTA